MKGDERISWCNEELHVNKWCKKQLHRNILQIHISGSLPQTQPSTVITRHRAIHISYTKTLFNFRRYTGERNQNLPQFESRCVFILVLIQWLLCPLVYPHTHTLNVSLSCSVYDAVVQCLSPHINLYRSFIRCCITVCVWICLEVHLAHSVVLMHGSLVKLSMFPLMKTNLLNATFMHFTLFLSCSFSKQTASIFDSCAHLST